MEVYISINGVLRNFIQKFDYHYREYFLESEQEEDQEPESFDYKVNYPIRNDNLMDYYSFQSKEEYDHFCYIEFPLELFGHAGLSYSTAVSDLNKLIYENKNINFTIVGLDELGKAKPSTLFFLSKNGFLGNNIKFIRSEDIDREWKKCNVWVTDNEEIIDTCPKNKKAIKFNTKYNEHILCEYEINDLNKIEEICSTSSEKTITSILMKSLRNVVQIMERKNLMKKKE